MDQTHDATPKQILEKILQSDEIDRDGLRIGLWASFYTGPAFAEIERRFGLLRDENNLLFCLANYGPLTATDVCEVTGRPKNSMSRAVERLLKKRLIRRETDQGDRRRSLLTIEPAGRKLHRQTLALALEREAVMLSSLSPVERVALDHILTKLMGDADKWMCSF